MGIETAALLTIASMAATTTATLYAADTAENTAEANAELARREGDNEKDAAVAQAEKIRKAGQAAAGRASAAMAAAGIDINEGTAVRINEGIYKDSEDDAYSTILTGSRRQQSANEQGAMLLNEGKAAKTSGYVNAGASLLSSGNNYSKWKTSQKKGE